MLADWYTYIRCYPMFIMSLIFSFIIALVFVPKMLEAKPRTYNYHGNVVIKTIYVKRKSGKARTRKPRVAKPVKRYDIPAYKIPPKETAPSTCNQHSCTWVIPSGTSNIKVSYLDTNNREIFGRSFPVSANNKVRIQSTQ
jgi:hypothetical protein